MDTDARPFIRRDGINWISLTAFTLFHVGAIVALFFFTWPAFFIALALYWLSLSLAGNVQVVVQLPRQSAPLIVGIALAAAASFDRSPDVGAMGFRGCFLNFRVGLAADKDSRACEI
jgi:chromate transport protein ChrA